MRAAQEKRVQQTKTQVKEAFEDLDTLMSHARDMVNLVHRLAASDEVKDNESEFDSLLQNMGIASPVTKQTAGSQYHTLLARQLADFLIKSIFFCFFLLFFVLFCFCCVYFFLSYFCVLCVFFLSQ